MPKAILEFSLPEEREEFELAQKAGALQSALYDLYQFLRTDSKYAEEPKYEAVYEKFWEIMKEHDVDVV